MIKTSELIWQDAQHQLLFQVIDDLKGDRACNRVVEQLHHYMESHFSLEEAYMLELEYPGYQKHVDAHNLFRRELGNMLGDFPDDPSQRDAISTYLRQWLMLHVMGIDKELEDFIQQSGRK